MADKDEEKQEAPKESGPLWKGSLSTDKPLKGPDGHEHVSAEDLKARG